jgi:hypothetical protein
MEGASAAPLWQGTVAFLILAVALGLVGQILAFSGKVITRHESGCAGLASGSVGTHAHDSQLVVLSHHRLVVSDVDDVDYHGAFAPVRGCGGGIDVACALVQWLAQWHPIISPYKKAAAEH